MPEHQPPDEWDRIEQWTARVWRWMLVGVPTWIVLLALLHEEWSRIPLAIGFMMASMLTLIVVAVDDLRRRQSGGAGLTPFGRIMMTWVGAFVAFAVAISLAGSPGVAIVLVPFLGATIVSAVVEMTRRALQQQRR